MTRQRLASFATVVLVVFGFVFSAYLLARYMQLAAPTESGLSDICAAVFGASCDETLASSITVQLGLPLPGWGLVYYAVLACLVMIAWGVGPFLRRASSSLFVLIALVGALISVLLAGLMLTGRAADCPVCYGIHAVNLLLLPAACLQTGLSAREILSSWTGALRYVFGGTMREPDLAAARVLGLLVPFLVGLAVYQGVLIQLHMRIGGGGPNVRADQVLAGYAATPEETVPVDPDDPTWGPEHAPVELVVFSDFQCPSCAEFAFALEGLRRQFDSELRVVFKHYPLDHACNPTVPEPFHEQACWAARLAQAAHEAGRFWEAHDVLFGKEITHDTDEVLTAVVEATGLEAGRLRERMEQPDIEAGVESDIESGNALGLPGTPSAFLNGRLLLDTRPTALRILILDQIEANEAVAAAQRSTR